MTARAVFARRGVVAFFATGFVATTVILLGVASARSGGGAPTRAQPCAVSDLPDDLDLRAVAPDARAIVSPTGESVFALDGDDEAILRNVASHPDELETVAVVRDGRSSDSLLVGSGSSMSPLLESTEELREPAWSPSGALIAVLEGDDVIAIVDAKTGDRRAEVPIPEVRTGVHTPAFSSETTLVAALAEQVDGDERTPGADTLNNLWEYDLEAGRWERLTDFTADDEHWSVIRTVTPAGVGDREVLFVRVTGATYGDRDDLAWSLWRSAAGELSEIRALPEEHYLGATTGRFVLFDTQDPRTAVWTIGAIERSALDDAQATIEPVACGSLAVDPAAADPDLAGEGAEQVTSEAAYPEGVVPVLVVSGFASPSDAMQARSDLDDDRTWVVASSGELPLVVAPGDVALVAEADPVLPLATQLQQVARATSVGEDRVFSSAADEAVIARLASEGSS